VLLLTATQARAPPQDLLQPRRRRAALLDRHCVYIYFNRAVREL
jgi:hypothetical protein